MSSANPNCNYDHCASCAANTPWMRISTKKNIYCGDTPIYNGASINEVDCEGKCSTVDKCVFYSYWHSGGENWCATSATCNTKMTQKHVISVFKRPGMPPPPPPTAHYALLLQVPRACNPSDVEHCFGLFSFLGLCHCLSQRCSELLCTHNKSACLHVPL